MVETISPVVHGGRATLARERSRCTRSARPAPPRCSAPTLGWIGGSLGAPWRRPGLLALAAVAARVRARRRSRGCRVPVPQLRRQVPDWWRTYFGRPFAAVLYGAGLGVGFLTYLSPARSSWSRSPRSRAGRPAVGRAHRGAVRAGARALRDRRVALDRRRSRAGRSSTDWRRTPDAPRRVVERRRARRDRDRGRRGSVVPGRPPGRGGRFAAAALAAVFTWAAASKIAGAAPLAARADRATACPRALERVGRWAVPSSEALVPVLVVAGLPRAAAVWSGVAPRAVLGRARRVASAGWAVASRAGASGARRSIDVSVRAGAERGVAPASPCSSCRGRGLRRRSGVAGLAAARRRAPVAAHARRAHRRRRSSRGVRPSGSAAGARVTHGTRVGSSPRLLPFALALLTVAVVTAVALAAGAVDAGAGRGSERHDGHAGRPSRVVRARGPARRAGRS